MIWAAGGVASFLTVFFGIGGVLTPLNCWMTPALQNADLGLVCLTTSSFMVAAATGIVGPVGTEYNE